MLGNLWDTFYNQFHRSFIVDDRWKYLTNGLLTTILITVMALAIGLLIGLAVAYVRVTYDNTGRLRFLNALARIYLTVIRGTPVMVQLMIIYFVIFASTGMPKLLAAVIAFGINSGAYVAEIFRGGIMSVGHGQTEAGRSLGLSYRQTMSRIVLPQAFKNSLPALGNEFIVLVKETSIAGVIAVVDLTRGANIIMSLTYNAFMPLTAVALVYLGVVMLLTYGLGKLERRLHRSDRR
ncbi:MAG: amino acid ABC transporter permease [Oscillospiraceae bacterium]|jgi:His/Glu/Gln/Arg/opine family amino acid ABC transporter permease subunit|nr:amino acid ABC transporter permease [Oscillospiraceae bacterium]